MSELDAPEPPERLAIPLAGPFRDLYNDAKDSDVEHPSSNLFSNLITFSLVQEGRRRIDHTFRIWSDVLGMSIPILVKESKAPGKKRNVEQQMYGATVSSRQFYNLTHLYGLSTIGTTFRVWTVDYDDVVQPYDSFALEDPDGYLDIESVDGTRLWNDLMSALLRNTPTTLGSVGQRSDDEPMDDAPGLDPQGIPGILNPELGEGDEAGGSAKPEWTVVEVKHANRHTSGNVIFEHNGQKLTLPQESWVHDGRYWRANVYSEKIQYYCEKVRNAAIEPTSKPKGKGKGTKRELLNVT